MTARQKNPNAPAPTLDGSAVEVVDDTGVEPIIEAGDDQQSDPGIEDLRKQLEAANSRAAEAERRATELASQRNRDASEVADSRLMVIDATISRQETEKKAIMARILEAKEAGDYQAELTAQDELSQINIDMKQAKLGKSRLSNEIEEAKTTQTRSDGDPLEAYIANNNMHPRAANWLRSHRDYAEDPVKNAELLLAHQRAIAGGAKLNSDEYYEAIETSLKLNGGADEQPEQQRESAPARQPMTPSAPVSRGTPMGSGGKMILDGIQDLGNGKYRVSKEVKEAADMSGITIDEYIKQAKLLSRGSDGQLH